jgi:hypothetical protein
MVFGAVFMSMPLAIIGNEYSEAWDEVISSLQEQHNKKLETASKRLKELFKHSVRLMPVAAVNAAVNKMKTEFERENGELIIIGEEKVVSGSKGAGTGPHSNSLNRDQIQLNGTSIGKADFNRIKVVELMTENIQADYNKLLKRSAMMEAHRRILPLTDQCVREINKSTRLTPMLLMYMTELRGWLVTLKTGSTFVIDQITKDMQRTAPLKAKRLSMIGIGAYELAQSTRRPEQASEDDSDKDEFEDEEDLEDDEESGTLLQILSDFVFGKKGNRHETEHSVMLNRLKKDPTNFRLRMWQMLEIRDSSKEATAFQFLTLSLILVSVLLLFAETLSSWNSWGPSSHLCGAVLNKYCSDKSSNVLDPGCFVFDEYGSVTPQKLLFDCENRNCFGHGTNFGGDLSNLTCPADATTMGSSEGSPFQSQDSLTYTYGAPIMFTSRPMMHRLSAICLRMECNPINPQSVAGGPRLFYICEIVITMLFSIEVCMRIAVADSVMRYFSSAMNIFDLFAIFPFFVEVSGLSGNSIDFGIISSSPETYFLVLARSFKVIGVTLIDLIHVTKSGFPDISTLQAGALFPCDESVR